jgi:cyclic-di-GMP-binding protein
MPSFDVVSEVNLMEVENAFNQARKEISQRFDFKGTSTDLERQADGGILIKANSDGRCDAAYQVLLEKLSKRGVPLEGVDPQAIEPAAGGQVKRPVKLRRGLNPEDAKKLAQVVKDTGLKVQAAIQGQKVRVSGKKRDDLQTCMQAIRAARLGIPLLFQNFQD